MQVFSFNLLIQTASESTRKEISQLVEATNGKFITNVDGKTKEELIADGRGYWAMLNFLFIEKEPGGKHDV
jgi:hypothetical protein